MLDVTSTQNLKKRKSNSPASSSDKKYDYVDDQNADHLTVNSVYIVMTCEHIWYYHHDEESTDILAVFASELHAKKFAEEEAHRCSYKETPESDDDDENSLFSWYGECEGQGSFRVWVEKKDVRYMH